jgi:hypothetical protein
MNSPAAAGEKRHRREWHASARISFDFLTRHGLGAPTATLREAMRHEGAVDPPRRPNGAHDEHTPEA